MLMVFGDGTTPWVTPIAAWNAVLGEQIRGYLGGDLDQFPRIVGNPCLVEDLAKLDTMMCGVYSIEWELVWWRWRVNSRFYSTQYILPTCLLNRQPVTDALARGDMSPFRET